MLHVPVELWNVIVATSMRKTFGPNFRNVLNVPSYFFVGMSEKCVTFGYYIPLIYTYIVWRTINVNRKKSQKVSSDKDKIYRVVSKLTLQLHTDRINPTFLFRHDKFIPSSMSRAYFDWGFLGSNTHERKHKAQGVSWSPLSVMA